MTTAFLSLMTSKRAFQFPCRPCAQHGSDASNVDEIVALSRSQKQTAEVSRTGRGRLVAANDERVAGDTFNHPPVTARPGRYVRPLGDYAFQPEF
ncbi:MAG: hypothetical protein EOP17_05520 [Rhizobiaceae bacterium]|nr:MAG: hypothetical protein EOP17_05520 [Rhizobiaceae bacterium]